MGYELDGRGIRFQFPARIRDVSLIQGVHTLSGTQSALFEKATQREANRSPTSTSEVKKKWMYTSNSLYFFMEWF
jgi:hypothetical protein